MLLAVGGILALDCLELLVDSFVLVPEASTDAADTDVIDNYVTIIQGESKLVAVVLDKRLSKCPILAIE